MVGLRTLLTKCNFADFDEEIDSHNKGQVLQLFKTKKVGKMSKYIAHLVTLDNEIRADKKLVKKVFSDKQAYGLFMQQNVEWILEKAPLHDFIKDEVHGLLLYCQKNALQILHGNQGSIPKELPAKFDSLLNKFIID